MIEAAVLYYTANRVSPAFGDAVRADLVKSVGGRMPVVCVSHRPLAFGDIQVCVGDVVPGIWQIYWNILQGAKAIESEFVCTAEDDVLYAPEHWVWRPSADTFGYDHERWTLDEDGVFWYRSRNSMALCTARRTLLIETLEERFAKFPVPIFGRRELRGWGEPGRYEGNLSLTLRQRVKWECTRPSVLFNHRPSTGGKRRRYERDLQVRELFPWGNGRALWVRFYG